MGTHLLVPRFCLGRERCPLQARRSPHSASTQAQGEAKKKACGPCSGFSDEVLPLQVNRSFFSIRIRNQKFIILIMNSPMLRYFLYRESYTGHSINFDFPPLSCVSPPASESPFGFLGESRFNSTFSNSLSPHLAFFLSFLHLISFHFIILSAQVVKELSPYKRGKGIENFPRFCLFYVFY